MVRGIRAATLPVLLAAAAVVLRADAPPQSQAAAIQVQLGNEFLDEGRYVDAVDAYQRALTGGDAVEARAARTGLIQAALRLALFDSARVQADALLRSVPRDPDALALSGDALWASGLFDEAEARYQQALDVAPSLGRAHHGIARALAAKSQLDAALKEAQTAVQLAPRDAEIHHTIGIIYERQHKFEDAANAFTNYVNLLPNKDRSEKADWSRSEIKFLRSFGARVPLEMEPGTENETYTVEFRVVNEKVVVRAKVNGDRFQEFVVDTGAENTVLTGSTARRLNVTPITYTLSAGVGEVGLRGLQLARIDTLELGTLKLRNVPCLVKDPPLRNLPTREVESLSPLSLGFSMIIDYKTHKITFGKHLPVEPADFELPLRLHRLATVRGLVDGTHAANFVVDTGGQVISISQATATQLGRPEPAHKIALKVYGSSGWDRDAFLMQGVDLAFNKIHFPNYNVVVLNLNAPSALLGFQVGGIVGHNFLKKYRVGIDLEHSVLRLKDIS
jgi:tetratricopeptide (TPR) repeat protein